MKTRGSEKEMIRIWGKETFSETLFEANLISITTYTPSVNFVMLGLQTPISSGGMAQ